MPIESIRHKGLWLLYEDDDACSVPEACADRLRDMLLALGAASSVEELRVVPGWRLEALGGELAGYWTLTVAQGCWLMFRFVDSDAFDLDLVVHEPRGGPSRCP
jgi:proteic killer suppression protein